MTLLALYYGGLFTILVVLIFLWNKKAIPSATLPIYESEPPLVSVLVAARNEEKDILSCLEALSRLRYPQDKLEVIIGNDHSEDATASIVESFIKDKRGFYLIHIHETLGTAKGKANVLAHLAQTARGAYFFITDADIQVPETWIEGMLKYMNEDTGIVSGATIIDDSTLSGKLQSLEWILAFGMIRVISAVGIPVTAVGNNMVISKKAYESVGGYENIPFSITEDFQLFKEVLKKGWNFNNIVDPAVVARSVPEKFPLELVKQRKRWMHGAVKLPKLLVSCLFLLSMWFPAIIVTLFITPFYGALLWGGKIFLQQVFIAQVMKQMNIRKSLLKYGLLFEIYSCLLSFLLIIYFILPFKVKWKGRIY